MKYRIGLKIEDQVNEQLLSDTLTALRKVEDEHGCKFDFYDLTENHFKQNAVEVSAPTSSTTDDPDEYLLSFGG